MKIRNESTTIIGSVAGDVIGSVFEGRRKNKKTTEFDLFNPYCRYTDDTVLTIAVADCILNEKTLPRQFGNTARTTQDAVTVGCSKDG